MRKSVAALLAIVLMYAWPVAAQRKPVPPKRPATPTSAPKPFPRSTEKKYPSLLWEISGKGMKKPSYLFGTMHVSDKLAFHLGDSFYNAIKSVEVVALETNPESWQDDYSKSTFFGNRRDGMRGMYAGRSFDYSNDHMSINTFAVEAYEEPLKAILAVEPSMINGMLYRTYGTQMADFEEDTFLDMYIFQVGRKLGKRFSGVENFEESEKLVMEAYRDMLKDRNRKQKSRDFEDMVANPRKVEDAYRKGDLDLLDSLEALTVFSDAFQEKFLYKRNEIQANSIDSIIKKQPLFVGVGAAHLPGRRGVIEMLRAMGYTMRPVIMDERSSVQKESLDKIRVEHAFAPQTSKDGFYKVSIPGSKFYHFTEWEGMDVVQYADLVNGAYYMVTRMKTNSLAWGHTTETVYKKLDSLLYENVPGKILKKTPITRNGYKGLDIVNRTRRGDCQRYNILITPFEVIIFKMSGNGDFVTEGKEADKFFGSIQLQEYTAGTWQNWQPATGGFSVDLPHTPSLLKDQFGAERLEYAAWDKQDGNSYLVMNVNLHNNSFIEEDTFELNLMDESYGFSSFIAKQLSHKFTRQNGYPALESKYQHKDGSYSTVKYIIRGPVYYAAIARYKTDNANVKRFTESFAVKPFIYPAVKERKDTTMHFTVQSPVFDDEEKTDELAGLEEMYRALYEEMAEELGGKESGSKTIGNDTVGEKVFVFWRKLPPSTWYKDSAAFYKEAFRSLDRDTTWITKLDKKYKVGNMLCREQQFTDTGSSRLIMARMYFTNGHLFFLSAVTDTISARSSLLQSFFDTFKPADTLTGTDVFVRKSAQHLKDLFSTDSMVARKASKTLRRVAFDSLDAPALKKAIEATHWGMYEYLETKTSLIAQLRKSKDTAVTGYLRDLYWKVKDTMELQQAILNTLTSQKTATSFYTFRDLIMQEPPITEHSLAYDYSPVDDEEDEVDVVVTSSHYRLRYDGAESYSDGPSWYHLGDSLALTKLIFKDILQLINIDDYEREVGRLLRTMIDSNMINAADYEPYFSKIYLDARQLLKKQIAGESNTKMERALRKERKKQNNNLLLLYNDYDEEEEDASDRGNYALSAYAVELLPFREKNAGVQTFFEQLMKVEDRRLLYNTFLLLLRNKQPVPDSLYLKFAKLDKYRIQLYRDLKKLKMTDKFPAQYKTQPEITKALFIKEMGSYEEMDTLVYIDKLPVTWKGKKGYVHFYKYRKMKDDVSWQLACVGMQPEKVTEVDVENDDFTDQNGRKLEKDKPVKVQMEKMLREMVYAKRESARDFYDGRGVDLQKTYLSEIVKRRRYRD